MSSQLASAMRTTTTAFVQAWETWTIDPIMAVRAPDCVMTQLPSSLQIPERNNEQFRAWFSGGAEKLLSNCKTTEHDYFASTEERRAWLYISLVADAKTGVYTNEYMFALTFDESGEKMTKIVEMMDSQRVREAWAQAAEVQFKRE